MLGRELEGGIVAGLAGAGLYCLYVLGLYALRGAAPFEKNETTLGTVLAVYLIAGLLGGTAFGLLHPLRRTLPGQLVLGVVIACLVGFTVTVAMHGPPTQWTRSNWEAIAILGLFFGAVGTFAARR